MIVIRGSDTEVNLVLELAESYMDMHQNVSIAVTGGGSGTGIASLINKKTDIANSSRSFKPSELALAENRQVKVVPLIFAVDAICIILNERSSLDSLSIQELRDIYSGKITNWSQLGGADLNISLYGRQGNSGTFIFIQRDILKGDYSPRMKQMNGTSQIVESIKNDVAGIGYAGVGYVTTQQGEVLKGIKVLSIRGDQQSIAISPLESNNILSGIYPIVRPLYQYVDGLPTGKVKEFIQFELSEQGQKIIASNGYFPISEKYRALNSQYLYGAKTFD